MQADYAKLEDKEHERIVSHNILHSVITSSLVSNFDFTTTTTTTTTVISTINKIDGTFLNYSSFFTDYMLENKPVIIKGLCDTWPATHNWVNHKGKPNLDFFLSSIFDKASSINVAVCDKKDFSDQKREQMTLKQFIEYWKDHKHKRKTQQSDHLLYLKDWHYVREFGKEHPAYTLPVYFCDDWINQFWDNNSSKDDYRFVYMGPRGTWTPLHSDVFNTYSWSSNICGKKQWLLFPPEQGPFLKDRFGKNLMYDVEQDKHNTVTFPFYHKATPIEVIQEAGETMFVPSGWYHQVTNLEDTISINHNWANGCNLFALWQRMQVDLRAVEEELDDCKDIQGWEHECQNTLRIFAGWNEEDFVDYLCFIAQKQFTILEVQNNINNNNINDNNNNNILMAIFNLVRIRMVLVDLRKYSYGEALFKGDNSKAIRNRNIWIEILKWLDWYTK